MSRKNGQRLDNNMAELVQKWQEGGGEIQLTEDLRAAEDTQRGWRKLEWSTMGMQAITE